MNNEQKPAQNSDENLRSFIIVTPYLLDTQANVLSVFAVTVEPVGQPIEVTGQASHRCGIRRAGGTGAG